MTKQLFSFLKSIYIEYVEDELYVKASALSYYTLLSIVPILAVVFGIAKGFGFEKTLENQILHTFYQQQEMAEKIIQFARSTLEHTYGTLIAGVGIIMLFWSALGLLNSFERALNQIWKIETYRPFGRQITDYLPVIIFGPIFIVAASSLTFVIITKIVELSSATRYYAELKPLIRFSYYTLLFFICWMFFTFLYIYLPGKKVPWTSCFLAAFFSALAFQAIQWAYIHLQIYLSSYNAIYGSFAAVPLFLICLQASWLIALIGAEIAAQHTQFWEDKQSESELSVSHKELILLTVAAACDRFIKRNPLSSVQDTAEMLQISPAIANSLLLKCYAANLLMETTDAHGQSVILPSGDPANITLEEVEKATDPGEIKSYRVTPSPLLQKVSDALSQYEEEQRKLPANLSIKSLLM